jgi:hypothetical protein
LGEREDETEIVGGLEEGGEEDGWGEGARDWGGRGSKGLGRMSERGLGKKPQRDWAVVARVSQRRVHFLYHEVKKMNRQDATQDPI